MQTIEEIMIKIRRQPYLDAILVNDIVHTIKVLMDECRVFTYKSLNESSVYVSEKNYMLYLAVDRTCNQILYGISLIDGVHKILNKYGFIDIQNVMHEAFKVLYGNNILPTYYEGPLGKHLSAEVMSPIDTYILGETLKYAC